MRTCCHHGAAHRAIFRRAGTWAGTFADQEALSTANNAKKESDAYWSHHSYHILYLLQALGFARSPFLTLFVHLFLLVLHLLFPLPGMLSSQRLTCLPPSLHSVLCSDAASSRWSCLGSLSKRVVFVILHFLPPSFFFIAFVTILYIICLFHCLFIFHWNIRFLKAGCCPFRYLMYSQHLD